MAKNSTSQFNLFTNAQAWYLWSYFFFLSIFTFNQESLSWKSPYKCVGSTRRNRKWRWQEGSESKLHNHIGLIKKYKVLPLEDNPLIVERRQTFQYQFLLLSFLTHSLQLLSLHFPSWKQLFLFTKSISTTFTPYPSSPPSLHSTLDLINQLFINLPIAPTSLSTQPMPNDTSLSFTKTTHTTSHLH